MNEQASQTHWSTAKAHVRVLIVDDDRDWCEAAQLALDAEGISADTAFDGDSALTLFGAGHYDAAIVDVQMPGRGGIDVVREMREMRGPSLPIVISTGATMAAGVCQGLLSGADDEFFKTDPYQEMVQKLRRLWRQRSH